MNFKRNDEFSLSVKKVIIEPYETNNNKSHDSTSQLKKQFNLPKKTIRNILSNKIVILKATDSTIKLDFVVDMTIFNMVNIFKKTLNIRLI